MLKIVLIFILIAVISGIYLNNRVPIFELKCSNSSNCALVKISKDKADYEKLKAVIETLKRTEIIEESPNLIHAVSTSRIMRFKDDVFIYFPAAKDVIYLKSSSRVGYSDLGVNKARLDQIQHSLSSQEQ